jgi:hypothetical protein
MSEAVSVGDTLLAGGDEYQILKVGKSFTKADILEAKDEFVEFKVKRVILSDQGI